MNTFQLRHGHSLVRPFSFWHSTSIHNTHKIGNQTIIRFLNLPSLWFYFAIQYAYFWFIQNTLCCSKRTRSTIFKVRNLWRLFEVITEEVIFRTIFTSNCQFWWLKLCNAYLFVFLLLYTLFTDSQIHLTEGRRNIMDLTASPQVRISTVCPSLSVKRSRKNSVFSTVQ